jgi:acyl CoA:acetate/3-ketoacid CoA transferase beta subunit
VDTVVTELCVFQRRNGSLCLTELLDGATVDDVAAVTTARFAVDDAVTLRA